MGLPVVDIDQSNAAFHAVLARHPDAKLVRAYVNNRADFHLVVGGSAEAAKALFRGLLAGGGGELIRQYAYDHGVDTPQVVVDFGAECREFMDKDCHLHPAELVRLRASGREYPEAWYKIIIGLNL